MRKRPDENDIDIVRVIVAIAGDVIREIRDLLNG
jgi:hypothetical protein